jgi:simple sugar transport system permease protein
MSPLGAAGLPLYLLLGFLGGGMAGALVGWLRARFGANEIIVTIMFNYVAVQLLTWVNRGPLQEAARIFPRSYLIGESLHLPVLLEGSRVHGGLLIAVAAALLVYLLMSRTSFGFRLAVLGENPDAASYAGIGRNAMVVWAMFLSGGLAGLAGATEVAGLYHRLEDGFADGLGLAAIAVALMARVNALAVPFAALFFGVFFAGAGALQRQAGVPFPIVWIIQGTVIFAFLALGWAARQRAVGT